MVDKLSLEKESANVNQELGHHCLKLRLARLGMPRIVLPSSSSLCFDSGNETWESEAVAK